MNRKELRAEIIAKIKNLSGMAMIRISSATVLELLDELNSAKQLIKELCDEWNEGCEKNCSSYGHDEECAGTNLAVAKRNLNQQLAAAQAKLKAQEELLKECEGSIVELIDVFNQADFRNGNTHPDNTQGPDEGEFMAYRFIARHEETLSRIRTARGGT